MSDLTAVVGGALFLAVLAAALIYLVVVFRRPGADTELAVMTAASRGLATYEEGWRRAMLAELAYIPNPRERRRFALGALGLIFKDDKWGVGGGVVLAMMTFPWASLLDPSSRSYGMRGIHPVLALPLLVVGVGGWTGRSWPACVRVGVWCGVAAGMLAGPGGVGFAWLASDNATLAGIVQNGMWMLVVGSASGFLLGVVGSTVGLLMQRIVRSPRA